MVWRILAAGSEAGTSPSLKALITETDDLLNRLQILSPQLEAMIAELEDLLARFHTLSPTELRRLAEQLDTIATWADDCAEQEEDGESHQ